ncbi:MAG: phosphatase PAP2 family protein [Planctomycetes bacterium]|nr:phosphatase PAP2 family protein [Planctomycetota bacterium]
MKGVEQSERKHKFSRQAVRIGVILLVIAAAAASYLFADSTVSGWFQNPRNTWHQNVWVSAFRQLGKAGVPIWLLLAWGGLTDRWRPAVVTLTALVLVSVSVAPLKAIVRRCRPSTVVAASRQALSLRDIPWYEKGSFPSGDTAVAFAVATTLSSSLGRLWAPALFAAAGAIGLFRVTGLAHYPSDVMAGALIGVLCGVYGVRWMARRYEWDVLRVKGLWRVAFLLILIFIVPLVSRFLGLTALREFLAAFGIPLLVLAALGWTAVQFRAWRGSPMSSVPLESPASKPDSFREPAS